MQRLNDVVHSYIIGFVVSKLTLFYIFIAKKTNHQIPSNVCNLQRQWHNLHVNEKMTQNDSLERINKT